MQLLWYFQIFFKSCFVLRFYYHLQEQKNAAEWYHMHDIWISVSNVTAFRRGTAFWANGAIVEKFVTVYVLYTADIVPFNIISPELNYM